MKASDLKHCGLDEKTYYSPAILAPNIMNPEKLLKLFQLTGIYPAKSSTILELGCGAGDTVKHFRDAGLNCFGCDISFKNGPFVKPLEESGIISKIKLEPYHLPYDDNTFDFVFSNQVFEHVMDYDSTLKELARILKPDAICFHTFPSKWRIFEAHTGTPLGGGLQNMLWVGLWAGLGINKRNPKGLSSREVARRDHEYLKNRTNYLTEKQIDKIFQKYGFSIDYVNDEAVQLSSNSYASLIGRYFPLVDRTTKTFMARFIVTKISK